MKKIQPSFVVEYKSGRRKSGSKSNSIWGNMDLRSVARDVQEETMPFQTPGENGGASDSVVNLPERQWKGPLLTPSTGHSTTAAAAQETIMANEHDSIANSDTQASIVPATEAPKKQRKPRAKKAAAETAAVDVSAEPAVVNAKTGRRGRPARGRKPKSPTEDANTTKKPPVRRAAKAPQAAAAAAPVASDEMAELLKLDEENQRLRKLLAEKLRAENADLRKRLNLA